MPQRGRDEAKDPGQLVLVRDTATIPEIIDLVDHIEAIREYGGLANRVPECH